MPSLQLFLLFLAADAALKLTPGPDMALTLSRDMTQGFRPAFHSVLGNVAAGFIQVPAVVLGLASVLHPTLFLAIKAAGGLYLGYLGIKAILRCARDTDVALAARPGEARDAFWQGFMTNLPNPKVLLFMIAFLPQFTTPDNGVDPDAGAGRDHEGVEPALRRLLRLRRIAHPRLGRTQPMVPAHAAGTAGRDHAWPGPLCALLHRLDLDPLIRPAS